MIAAALVAFGQSFHTQVLGRLPAGSPASPALTYTHFIPAGDSFLSFVTLLTCGGGITREYACVHAHTHTNPTDVAEEKPWQAAL